VACYIKPSDLSFRFTGQNKLTSLICALINQGIGFIFPIHYSEQINFVNLCLDKSRHRIYLSDSLLKAIYKIYTLFLYNLHFTTNQYEIQIYFKKTLLHYLYNFITQNPLVQPFHLISFLIQQV